MNIDMNHKYQTRDGKPVRILCTDLRGAGALTIVGLIMEAEGHEVLETWTADGRVLVGSEECADNIVAVPEKHEAWALMEGKPWGGTVKGYRYDTEAEAEAECRPSENEVVVHLIWRA